MPEVLDAGSAREWEQWLKANHKTVNEGVWLRMASITWDEAVDVAICYGWIDGQAKKHDDGSRLIRFTPRRRGSNWSKINTERVERAAAFFKTLNKRNTYPVVYRLETAKTPETRAKRIAAMIEMFEQGKKFYD
jgi:uncharacterized protein YdeI (YjbR/CyaY-like superfamily)